jgi:outer membrane protein TolC
MTRILHAFVLAGAFALAVDSDLVHAQGAPIKLSVADAVARGFEASHRLGEIRARAKGARASIEGAQAADKPTLNASAGYARTNHVSEFSFPQPNGTRLVVYPDIPDNMLTRVMFQWPIYTSGRTDALERAERAEAEAIGADLDAARADLRFEIVRAYWAAVTARETTQVIAESVARAEAQLNDARQRFAVGLIPPNEVSSLQAQRSREQSQLIEARNLQESTLIELRRLIGAEPDTVIELSEGLDSSGSSGPSGSSGSDLVKEALERRPERKALNFRIGSAEAREQAVLAATKPTVALGSTVDWANPNAKIFPRQSAWLNSWDLSVNVNWAMFDWGRTRAQASQVAAVAEAARERLAELDTIVAADVRQRLLDLDSSQALVQAASDAVTSAAEARRVVGDRFAAGVATSTDVLVAQVALLENGLARMRALASVKLAEARLQRAVGRP